ncbi:hypothetical protein DFJ73DRAFT_763214 [Zopfochytrium polystomum]|nr:hypothetical protein DFJ73DRAFT_763214 [Zopfochytrium polystomum]
MKVHVAAVSSPEAVREIDLAIGLETEVTLLNLATSELLSLAYDDPEDPWYLHSDSDSIYDESDLAKVAQGYDLPTIEHVRDSDREPPDGTADVSFESEDSQAVFSQLYFYNEEDVDYDFMWSSSCSITALDKYNFGTSYHKLCKCKEQSRQDVLRVFEANGHSSDILVSAVTKIRDSAIGQA